MIEPEMAFADLKDDMLLAESMLKYIIRYVLENAPEEMKFFNSFVDKGLIERLEHVIFRVVTWNISPAPSQSEPVMIGVCT